ncbi:metallophosphoesterase [Cronobacter sakazakii]|uniref:metallophosphoesterase n=1 Tax=Cronobacter sakazakii TaxID=28141 RepID=UPI000CF1AE03|nr:metallophosphoesterase [Cronobacter sakazakii]EIX1502937.1 metallophosphoesterase [Cronobacter sakazakii]EIX1523810.1 metallophosphoesterase [Cronobacter sakazakii]EIX1533705.1 metallophosphoesterase [Cronobacter sakazakii]EIX1621788.1 metallophosphoesterase [Cronobacter sakazakii]EIX1662701.1 metallophosphoesterase [Cronobacter sakazakii]
MYQRIDGAAWRHIFIVGDLHGCLEALVSALKRERFDPRVDALISVGDLIDRGPDSLGCLRLIGKRWFFAVRGNHEAMAVEALDSGDNALWAMNGGSWYFGLSQTAQQEAQAQFVRVSELPLVIEVQSHDRVIVVAHADYPASRYVWGQPLDEQAVVWSRARVNRVSAGKAEHIEGADACYFGHTPLREPLTCGNLHYIDTGAVFGNTLTLVRVQ